MTGAQASRLLLRSKPHASKRDACAPVTLRFVSRRGRCRLFPLQKSLGDNLDACFYIDDGDGSAGGTRRVQLAGRKSRVWETPAQKTQTPQASQTAQPPNSLNTARRITAEELHKLWQKDEVLIVDTRNEPSFKQGHIRGAILIPTNEFASRADELPKSKMIVTYCT